MGDSRSVRLQPDLWKRSSRFAAPGISPVALRSAGRKTRTSVDMSADARGPSVTPLGLRRLRCGFRATATALLTGGRQARRLTPRQVNRLRPATGDFPTLKPKPQSRDLRHATED